jgi:hypothetical protein
MANVGDRIIVGKTNGKFDIFKINEAGERERVRKDIEPLHQAWEIARGSLAGTQIWICDEATPDVLRPYQT